MAFIELSHHVAHATATLSELTLALSIGSITKIFVKAPIVDPIARETTIKRIQEQDGIIATLFYKGGCFLNRSIGLVVRNIPWLTFIFELGVVFCLAYETGISEALLFWATLMCFFLVIGYVYFNSETNRKTNERPNIDPLE